MQMIVGGLDQYGFENSFEILGLALLYESNVPLSKHAETNETEDASKDTTKSIAIIGHSMGFPWEPNPHFSWHSCVLLKRSYD